MSLTFWFWPISESTTVPINTVQKSEASELDLKLREHTNISEMAKSTVYHALGLGISEKPENKNLIFYHFFDFFLGTLRRKVRGIGVSYGEI